MKECYESRKRERVHDLKTTHSGTIRKGQSRQHTQETGSSDRENTEENWGNDKKGTSVNSQDQRRMLQTISNSFPSNVWIHRITKGKESNKCDLCKALRIKENHFTTEADLPEQDLGHIQHTCEALTETHTTVHHRSPSDPDHLHDGIPLP